MKKLWTIAPALALLAITACGNDSPEAKKESLSEETSCSTLTEESSEEMFVREMFICDGGPRVYTFNNTDGRDSWLEMAETFGVVVIDKGDDWLKVEE